MRYHQGKYTPKQPQKYLGDPTTIIYRSSWELKFFNWCDSTSSVEGWASEEIIIPYRCPTDNKIHRYFPDALIKIRNKEGILNTYLIEIKPFKETQTPTPPKNGHKKRYLNEVMVWGKNTAKWDSAREYCKNRGYIFMILTEYDLFGNRNKVGTKPVVL